MVQGKDTLIEKHRFPCQSWCHSPKLFIRPFLRFVILLMLHHSGKIAIPRYHLFLLLQIMHLILFKSLQRQGNLRISGDRHIFFWWPRDGNRRLSFLRRADLPSVWNGFVAIYFRPIFDCQFRKVVLLVLQQCGTYCVAIGVRFTTFRCIGLFHWHCRWCVI